MTNTLRIVFAGTPEFAVSSLKALLCTDRCVVGVYTQPDRPAGRGRKLRPSPIKQLAVKHELPVFQPSTLKTVEAQGALTRLKPDLLVVVAYGLILPQEILDIPTYGCINVHGSLLPRWRGAAPVQRAILAADTETGVTIMQMDSGLDTGPMLHRIATNIGSDESAGQLGLRLAELGAQALLQSLEMIRDGSIVATKQDQKLACYAAKIAKSEAELDFGESADQLVLAIRAFNPVPVAYTFLAGDRVRIWSAKVTTEDAGDKQPGTIFSDNQRLLVATGDGVLDVTNVQPAGGRRMTGSDYLNARAIQGQRFGGV